MGISNSYKQGEKIPVGKVGTRKYRLLATLIEPLGVAKTVDSVFDAIRLSRDESDGSLRDDYFSQTPKLERIEFTIKELQKIPGLRGKIRLGITGDKRSVRLIVGN